MPTRRRWGFLVFSVIPVALLAWAADAPPRQPSPDAMPADMDRGPGGLVRWLHALQTRASLMEITAHPDDEDGGMLAFETRGAGARGILFSLTRGEGGQNAMSPDLYDALGLIRTQELLASDRYYGVAQLWGSEADYGFSKTREEAIEKWGHDRVLADAVRAIRMTRPLVLTSVFVGAPTDGHGQHQIAGEVNQEVYLAAGDPNRFPEQIREGLRPWSPLKVYARVPIFDVTPQGMYDYATDKYVPVRFFDYISQTWSNQKPAPTVAIPEGSYAPANGMTFFQIAREGLGLQKSQNSGMAIPPPEPFASEYHRYGSRVTAPAREESLFDGIDVSVTGIGTLVSPEPEFLKSGLAAIARSGAKAAAEYRAEKPAAIAPELADGLGATRAAIAQLESASVAEPGKSDALFELRVKEEQFEKALAAALGVSIDAEVLPEREPRRVGPYTAPTPTFTVAIPGQTFGVRVAAANESGEDVRMEAALLETGDGKEWKIGAKSVKPSGSLAHAAMDFVVTAPNDAALTRPYFTRPNDEQPYYDIGDPRYLGLPFAPHPLAASLRFSYRGQTFGLSEVVQALERTPGLGIEQQPLLMGPPISVTVAPGAGAVPVGEKSFAFQCTVHSNVKGPAEGALRLELPAGWRSTPESAKFAMTRDGEDQTIAFSIAPNAVRPQEYKITAVAEYQGRKFGEGYRLAGYPGLRPYPWYRKAVYRAVGVDVKTAPGLRAGYLPGAGDDVPGALESLGVNVRTLSSADIERGDLSSFDAIFLGTRAYTARPELASANGRLLDYVRNGGVLIVQYNLQDFDREYGPYPFSLGSNPQKVVDEKSAVRLLEPRSPVFTWPNRITEADFSNWVEERGHGFMQTWDPRYQALFETHDPDQDPQRGGLLMARYGKGIYIYDALAIYRQLSAGVPGAYRILANLASLKRNPGPASK